MEKGEALELMAACIKRNMKGLTPELRGFCEAGAACVAKVPLQRFVGQQRAPAHCVSLCQAPTFVSRITASKAQADAVLQEGRRDEGQAFKHQ